VTNVVIVPCQWIWLVSTSMTYFATNSVLCMQTGRTLQGTHIDAVGPYSLQISEMQNVWILVALCNSDFRNTFPVISLKHSLYGLPIPSLPHKITYIKTVLRQKRSQIWLFISRIILHTPQLNSDCDRIVVLGLPPSYGMDINTQDVIRLIQIMMVIRILVDYCRCDIYIVDFGDITFCHISNITPSLLKNFELCVLVGSTYNFCVYKDNIA